MYKTNCCPFATANIKGGNITPNLSGQVKFYQKRGYVLVSAEIEGLPKTDSGFFGFHIHEGESCEGEDFSKSGSHYNPQNAPHPAHAGDMPPLISCNGSAYMTFATDRFKVSDIIGKTVIIHNRPDDFNSQPSGNAGTKIACGVIGR